MEPHAPTAVHRRMWVLIVLAVACSSPSVSSNAPPEGPEPEPVVAPQPALPQPDPLPGDQIWAVIDGEPDKQLVGIDASGRVARYGALPGLEQAWAYEPRSAHHLPRVTVGIAQRRVAWVRGEDHEVVAATLGGPPEALGRTSEVGGIGLLDGRWAWASAHDRAIEVEGGARIELPSPASFRSNTRGAETMVIHFVGGDHMGRPCALGGFISDRGPLLLCLRGEAWVEQPQSTNRTRYQTFAGLTAGGSVSDWYGNYKYDCGLGSCGSFDALDDATNEPRVRRYHHPDDWDGSSPRSVSTDWYETSTSVDGSVTLVRSDAGGWRVVATEAWREHGSDGVGRLELVALQEAVQGLERVPWRSE